MNAMLFATEPHTLAARLLESAIVFSIVCWVWGAIRRGRNRT